MAETFQVIKTDTAPEPLPQFSQAVTFNGMVYCSGNIGLLPGDEFKLVDGTVKDRARQALKNLSNILEASGSSLQNVVKMNLYITKFSDFGLVNEAYDEFFVWEKKPARTCVAVFELPFGTDIEIECTAFLNA
ncbi:Endoribonuclease L-PSP/chorismate mutase-like protein [Plectosphaerella plurivora]|uniref:Endoribonuclease L-PSP/chorismate mutase-like protein n=1 Tax=Plectosphaerella plurivora TaxID=936078 RepID=A0A9P8VFZ9_9PEZI|nr:Endoribonuclease L-PSP/chorismate mutase-like protein [Plectosphaerella plurivora]